MSSKGFTAGLAAAMLATSVPPGLAGQPVACFERTRTPPVYGSVTENVLLHPGSRRVEIVPPIKWTRNVVYGVPEGYSNRLAPAEYADVEEPYLVRPERWETRTIPAETRTVWRKVKVAEPRYAWEWRVIDGRRVLCKVKRKAVYRQVAETVVVAPPRSVRVKVAAEWGSRRRTVLVAPERIERVWHPAEYAYDIEEVTLQPEIDTVIDQPPSSVRVHREVLVSPGRTGWRPVPVPSRCR